MNPDLYFEPFEVSEFTERFHAALGRALIIGTRFERSVVELATLLEVAGASSVLTTDGLWNELVAKIVETPLAAQVEPLLGTYPDAVAVLSSAKGAVNHIVHKIALGLDRPLDSTKTAILSDQVLDMYDDVRSVAAGDMLVCALIEYLSYKTVPDDVTLTQHSAAVADWVCNTDELGEML
ncbi:MAG: hypothetical protein WD492_03240 [Alkalispirochaeta sp.]